MRQTNMWPGYTFEYMPKAHVISSTNKKNKQCGVGFITLPRQTLCDYHNKFILSAAVSPCKVWGHGGQR